MTDWDKRRREHCRICGRHVRDTWAIYEVVAPFRGHVYITVRCVVQEECWEVRDAATAKARRRQERPLDLGLKPLHDAVRGECRWCGEAIYRKDKDGRIVIDRRRMWHEGREIDERAEPEPECVQQYNAQKFTFREGVGAKDNYVCQACGLDVAAELEAYDREKTAFEEWNRSVYEREDEEERIEWQRRYEAGEKTWGFKGAWEHRRERSHDWVKRNGHRPAWHADHVIPLEDGGLHELANGQVLCPPCHSSKTAQENRERAARRRGELSREQLELA